jgi:hypothetical protein
MKFQPAGKFVMKTWTISHEVKNWKLIANASEYCHSPLGAYIILAFRGYNDYV